MKLTKLGYAALAVFVASVASKNAFGNQQKNCFPKFKYMKRTSELWTEQKSGQSAFSMIVDIPRKKFTHKKIIIMSKKQNNPK